MSEFGKNIGALDNGYFDREGMLNSKGVDFLCAAILRQAYTDLMNAYLADAAVRWREISYNCYEYYERLRRSNRNYHSDRKDQPKTMKQVQLYAKADIEKIDRWFRYSEACKIYCRTTDGEWFADIAKQKVISFVKDEVPRFRVLPKSEDPDAKAIRRWEKRRDEWRLANGLSPVRKENDGNS